MDPSEQHFDRAAAWEASWLRGKEHGRQESESHALLEPDATGFLHEPDLVEREGSRGKERQDAREEIAHRARFRPIHVKRPEGKDHSERDRQRDEDDVEFLQCHGRPLYTAR